METKNIILKLRTERGMSQDELADKIMVTRQAVSRWENGDTVPNTDTLKLLSKEFDVSINTLLGEPRKLICQCCGMPIDDDSILGRDKDGTLNEEYCKWCYADGTYTYNDMDELIDVCVKNMVNENFTEEQARTYLKEMLPKLDYWKRYDELSDNGQFEEFKMQLINEINDLHIDGLPRVDKLNALVGKYVNLEYTLPNGQKVKFLDDQKTYLGNQLESEFGGDRCFGILAGMDFILVMYVNDNPITLDTPACVIDDRTLVPVRAISEAFDCYVSWNGEQQTVLIYSENTDFYQIKELIFEYLYGEQEILESYLNILIDVNNALKEGHDYYGVTFIDRNSININNDERFSSAKNNLFQIYNKVFQYDTSKLPSELTEVMRHVKNSAESIKDFADELSLEVSFDDLSKIHENVNNAENEMNIAINLLTNEATRRNIINIE